MGDKILLGDSLLDYNKVSCIKILQGPDKSEIYIIEKHEKKLFKTEIMNEEIENIKNYNFELAFCQKNRCMFIKPEEIDCIHYDCHYYYIIQKDCTSICMPIDQNFEHIGHIYQSYSDIMVDMILFNGYLVNEKKINYITVGSNKMGINFDVILERTLEVGHDIDKKKYAHILYHNDTEKVKSELLNNEFIKCDEHYINYKNVNEIKKTEKRMMGYGYYPNCMGCKITRFVYFNDGTILKLRHVSDDEIKNLSREVYKKLQSQSRVKSANSIQ